MTLKNIEDVEVKLNARQMAIYLGGVIFATVVVMGAYMGISRQLSDMAKDNQALRTDLKNINIRLDQHLTQSEVRYLEVKLEMEKKQDKKQ